MAEFDRPALQALYGMMRTLVEQGERAAAQRAEIIALLKAIKERGDRS